MQKQLMFTFSLLILSSTLLAQNDSYQGDFGYFTFQGRYLMPDFKDFNTEVEQFGFTGLGEDGLIEYGIVAGQQQKKRVSTFGISWVRPSGNGNRPHTQYRHFMVESSTTYSFLKKARTALGLQLGLAGRWSNLVFTSTDEANNALDALKIDQSNFRNFGLPIWGGLQFQTVLGKKDGGFLFGLGGGYRFDRARRWKIEDAATWKTDNLNLSGFFAEIRLGLAGRDSFRRNSPNRNTSL